MDDKEVLGLINEGNSPQKIGAKLNIDYSDLIIELKKLLDEDYVIRKSREKYILTQSGKDYLEKDRSNRNVEKEFLQKLIEKKHFLREFNDFPSEYKFAYGRLKDVGCVELFGTEFRVTDLGKEVYGLE